MDKDSGEWIRDAIKSHETVLIRYATRLLKDEDRARDCVQDTFLKLCKQDRSKVDGHLLAWLYTVCRNRAFEIMRKEKRMNPMNDLQMEFTSSDEPDPSAVLTNQDDKGLVQDLIKKLPDRQQELIRLKFQDGLSYKEISEVMDLSVSNVGVILHEAIKKIRKEFKKQPGLQALR